MFFGKGDRTTQHGGLLAASVFEASFFSLAGEADGIVATTVVLPALRGIDNQEWNRISFETEK
jgi:hypothetical protein